MDDKREVDLAGFKNEHVNYVTITTDEVEGGKTIEIFNKGTYFFQIRWKLYVSQKNIGMVKNVCRIACTEDGNIKIDDCIRKISEHFIIKQHLRQCRQSTHKIPN